MSVLAPLAAVVVAVLGGYGPPERAGTVRSPAIPEASGIVAASRGPAAWWVVNDSGNAASLHAVDAGGRALGSVAVTGAANRDWEDLAAGPHPGGGRALYVADVGDNARARDDLAVYRVPEPRPGDRATRRAEALPFRYPDGRHDAEAIAVDPGGTVYVLTKGAPTRVYRFPLPLTPGRRVTLERLPSSLAGVSYVTGAAVAPGGRRLVVRTYLRAYELSRPAGLPFARTFGAPPAGIRLALEPAGEAIAYSRDGRALVTLSEGVPATLWRYPRVGG